uniref:PUL domain-containing protein n=1 Tax=Arcella intermedia TaxID=1963864 RepID=A0A6B2L6Y0_9EUKA
MRATSQARGITAMPTFQFYKNGAMITEMKGANSSQLERLVRQYSGPAPEKPKVVVERSPYSNFPQARFCYFEVMKNLPMIKKKILEENEKIGDTHQLTNGEIVLFEGILDKLTATSFYHASKFDTLQYAVLLKLLQWPNNKNLPALDILRLMVLHPDAASHYAASYENDKEDNVIAICVSFLMETELPDTIHFMVWRFFCNLFKEERLHTSLKELFRQLLDIAESSYLDHKNIQVKLAIATLCFNYSVLSIREKDSEKKHKITSFLLSFLPHLNDPEILQRGLLALGTCCYKEPQIQTQVNPSLDKLNGQMDTVYAGQQDKILLLKEELSKLIHSNQ